MTVLDQKHIEKLRKEFLLLMKNAKIVKSYGQAEKWKFYIRKWIENFKDLWHERVPLFIRRKFGSEWEERWAKEIRKSSHMFLQTFREIPLKNIEWEREHSPSTTEGYLFSEFQRAMPKWEAKVRRQARDVWKFLDSVVDWVNQKGKSIQIPRNHRMQIAGFTVVFKNAYSDYPTEEDFDDLLERVRASFAIYKQRASKVLPLLIRNPLPFVIDFGASVFGPAGEYHGNMIRINPHGFGGNLREWVFVIAHEVGHHLWKTYLSSKDQGFWERAISGNYGTLNLWKVYKKYGQSPGAEFYGNPQIRQEDPILYLQIQGLFVDPKTRDTMRGVLTMAQLHDYLNRGGREQFRVHGKPITAYAMKDDEEAFCDAIGMLVGYGPRTVLPEVREWLRVILPSLRIAKRIQ